MVRAQKGRKRSLQGSPQGSPQGLGVACGAHPGESMVSTARCALPYPALLVRASVLLMCSLRRASRSRENTAPTLDLRAPRSACFAERLPRSGRSGRTQGAAGRGDTKRATGPVIRGTRAQEASTPRTTRAHHRIERVVSLATVSALTVSEVRVRELRSVSANFGEGTAFRASLPETTVPRCWLRAEGAGPTSVWQNPTRKVLVSCSQAIVSYPHLPFAPRLAFSLNAPGASHQSLRVTVYPLPWRFMLWAPLLRIPRYVFRAPLHRTSRNDHSITAALLPLRGPARAPARSIRHALKGGSNA
jgi:hypothetical protein